jgi:molecular chaperone GrpE
MADKKHSKKSAPKPDAAVAEGEVPESEDSASPAPAPEVVADEPVDELARVTGERDEYLDHLRRLQAEFDNYRKRVQREGEALRLRAAEAVVESLLPVVDSLGRALEAADRHEEGQIIAGLRLVAEQLRGTLAGQGLDEIDVQPGVLFDPSFHEAVVMQESESGEEGTVLQVLERGYLLHGRLLRPAKVIVVR